MPWKAFIDMDNQGKRPKRKNFIHLNKYLLEPQHTLCRCGDIKCKQSNICLVMFLLKHRKQTERCPTWWQWQAQDQAVGCAKAGRESVPGWRPWRFPPWAGPGSPQEPQTPARIPRFLPALGVASLLGFQDDHRVWLIQQVLNKCLPRLPQSAAVAMVGSWGFCSRQ